MSRSAAARARLRYARRDARWTPMPYASTSGDLRATTRNADDQLGELLELRRFVVVSR